MKTLKKPLRILLVDDHILVRRGLAALVNGSGRYTVVGEAGNGLEAVALAQQVDADIMILDLSMPGMNGLDALKSLRVSSPALSVVILSMYDDVPFVLRALRGGARGYVLKQSLEDELFNALQAVARGERYLSPLLNVQRYEDDLDQEPGLTQRERQVLQQIAHGSTTRHVADALGISWHTANRHRANLMHKLGAHNQIELVQNAARHGLVLPGKQ